MNELQKLYEELAGGVAGFRKEIKGLEERVRDAETKANRPGGALPGGLDQSQIEHHRAFDRFLRSGDATELRQKAMSVGSDPDGGWSVPQSLERSIFEMARNASPMLGLVRRIPAGQDQHDIIVNVGGTASSWVGENDTRSETATSSFAKVTVQGGEIYANPSVTQKLLDDAGFDVAGWLSGEVGKVFGEAIDTAILSGDGINKPKGILSSTFAATADATRAFGTLERLHSGTSASFDADDLIDLEAKLKPAYRAKGTWVMSASTWAFVRKLKASGSGDYLAGTLGGGAPAQILGHPVVLDESVPAMAASSYSVLFGDFAAAYTATIIRGVRVLVDPFTNKPRVHYYTTQRIGGSVVDSAAVKALYLA